MSRRLPIHRYHCPAIRKHFDVFAPKIDHWLDRDYQSLTKNRPSAWLAVVRHLRFFVHCASHAMPAVVLDYRVAKRLDVSLNRVAHVAKPVTHLALVDC